MTTEEIKYGLGRIILNANLYNKPNVLKAPNNILRVKLKSVFGKGIDGVVDYNQVSKSVVFLLIHKDSEEDVKLETLPMALQERILSDCCIELGEEYNPDLWERQDICFAREDMRLVATSILNEYGFDSTNGNIDGMIWSLQFKLEEVACTQLSFYRKDLRNNKNKNSSIKK